MARSPTSRHLLNTFSSFTYYTSNSNIHTHGAIWHLNCLLNYVDCSHVSKIGQLRCSGCHSKVHHLHLWKYFQRLIDLWNNSCSRLAPTLLVQHSYTHVHCAIIAQQRNRYKKIQNGKDLVKIVSRSYTIRRLRQLS